MYVPVTESALARLIRVEHVVAVAVEVAEVKVADIAWVIVGNKRVAFVLQTMEVLAALAVVNGASRRGCRTKRARIVLMLAWASIVAKQSAADIGT